MNQVIVIGAGAAGMTAAIFAARQGAKVIILEHTAKAGKKILSTGNGKCNLTNIYQEKSCYRGNDSDFAMEVLQQFGVEDTLEFMKSIGILTKNKSGYLYPRSQQAVSVVEGLLMELASLNVEIVYEISVKKIEKSGEKFKISTSLEKTYKCDKLILATGSKAAPSTGSDGSGYELAKSFGHKIVKPLPALVQLKCAETSFYKEAAGVRCDAVVKILSNEVEIVRETGELQITNYGISGIPVMQVSRYAIKAMDMRKEVKALIDFFPEMNQEELMEVLKENLKRFSKRTLEECLNGLMNKKLSSALLHELGIKKNFPAGKCNENDMKILAQGMKEFETVIIGANSFKEAQVCQGGVTTKEVNSLTMESQKCSGLYFAGEILDIDGTCGGYNLQFAWGTGALAGINSGTSKNN